MKPIVRKESPIEQMVSVEMFVGLVHGGMNLWAKAGEVLVKLVEQNPNIYADIIATTPSITFEMLLAFERMGRKQIYPPLLMDNSPGARKLLELPYEIQEKFTKDQVEVVIDATNGNVKTTKKYVKELSPYESRVVFDTTKMRTLHEQAEYMKSHGKQGRKPRKKQANVIGTFILKISPSGAIVAEKTTGKTMCPKLFLHEKGGVRQCTVNICESE